MEASTREKMGRWKLPQVEGEGKEEKWEKKRKRGKRSAETTESSKLTQEIYPTFFKGKWKLIKMWEVEVGKWKAEWFTWKA